VSHSDRHTQVSGRISSYRLPTCHRLLHATCCACAALPRLAPPCHHAQPPSCHTRLTCLAPLAFHTAVAHGLPACHLPGVLPHTPTFAHTHALQFQDLERNLPHHGARTRMPPCALRPHPHHHCLHWLPLPPTTAPTLPTRTPHAATPTEPHAPHLPPPSLRGSNIKTHFIRLVFCGCMGSDRVAGALHLPHRCLALRV